MLYAPELVQPRRQVAHLACRRQHDRELLALAVLREKLGADAVGHNGRVERWRFDLTGIGALAIARRLRLKQFRL